MSVKINYKYNEKELLSEFSSYIDKTYGEHYSKDRFQATEFIMDGGHGEGLRCPAHDGTPLLPLGALALAGEAGSERRGSRGCPRQMCAQGTHSESHLMSPRGS